MWYCTRCDAFKRSGHRWKMVWPLVGSLCLQVPVLVRERKKGGYVVLIEVNIRWQAIVVDSLLRKE